MVDLACTYDCGTDGSKIRTRTDTVGGPGRTHPLTTERAASPTPASSDEAQQPTAESNTSGARSYDAIGNEAAGAATGHSREPGVRGTP